MWRVVLLISFLFSFFHCIETKAEKPLIPRQKVFILNVTIHPELELKLLPRDLQTQIQEELPRYILEQRNLQFEDISAYSDAQQWNPANKSFFRQGKRIQHILSERNLRWMLVFSLSASPNRSAQTPLLLTGRLYDLDKFGCLESESVPSESVAEPKKAENKPPSGENNDTFAEICRDVHLEGTSRVMIQASVSFSNLRDGLRQLFSKLFRIPQIEIGDSRSDTTLLPDESVSLHFALRSNYPETESRLWSNQVSSGDASRHSNSAIKNLPRDAFAVDAVALRLNERTPITRICADPEKSIGPVQVDPEGFLRVANRHRVDIPVDAIMASHDSNMQGYGVLQFAPPPIAGDYLLRINFAEREDMLNRTYIPAFPGFKCFHIREPSILIHTAVGMQFSQNSDATLRIESGSSFNFEFGIMRGFSAIPTQYLFPAGKFGVILTGAYPFSPARAINDLAVPSSVFVSYLEAKNVDLRIRLSLEATRVGSSGLFLSGGLGLGGMHVERGNVIDNKVDRTISSWHPIFVAETGFGLPVRMPYFQSTGVFYFLYQWQDRLTSLEKLDRELVSWGTGMHSIQFGIFADIVARRGKL